MSRKRKIWAVVSLAAALGLLIPLCLRWQAQWRLHAYRKKLIASGEKLTVEELAPKRNWQATNTALFLKLASASALMPFEDLSPPAMRPIKPGVALVVWRQTRCMEIVANGKTAIDIWPVLTDAVGTNQAILSQLQGLLDAGGIEFNEDYSQPEHDVDSHRGTIDELVMAFRAGTMLALHEGRKEEAFEYLKSSAKVCQLTAKVPTVLDQWVSYSCMTIAAAGCWEALQAGGWTDAQLAELQHQLDAPDILAAAESSLVMERARVPMFFQMGRTSRQDLDTLLGGTTHGYSYSGLRNRADIWHDSLFNAGTGLRELLASYPRYWGWRWIWSYPDEQRYLEIMQTSIEATRDAQKRNPVFGFLNDRAESSTLKPPFTQNFDMAGWMTGGNKDFVGQALRAQTVANMVTTAIALKRFRLKHHAYPAALADLAPEFLSAVPVDCMDGHDLRYRLNPDGTYLLYSVGDDGVDNGGDPTPKEGSSSSFWYYGRDLVWPSPATEQEVQAYEAEQAKPKAGTKR